jgi:hypothetical protein
MSENVSGLPELNLKVNLNFLPIQYLYTFLQYLYTFIPIQYLYTFLQFSPALQATEKGKGEYVAAGYQQRASGLVVKNTCCVMFKCYRNHFVTRNVSNINRTS